MKSLSRQPLHHCEPSSPENVTFAGKMTTNMSSSDEDNAVVLTGPLHRRNNHRHHCQRNSVSAPRLSSTRSRGLIASAALPICLLLAPDAGSALSSSSAAFRASPKMGGGGSPLLDRAREMRRRRTAGVTAGLDEDSHSADRSFLLGGPTLDNDGWSSTLFDDGLPNSLEGVISDGRKRAAKAKANANTIEKRRAEEFDLYMEESAAVSSLVDESRELVEGVMNGKGAEVDAEEILQRQARERRRRLDQKVSAAAAKNNKKAKIVRRSKLSSKIPPASVVGVKKEAKKKKGLSREDEYALARTIQSGARIHRIKSDFESQHSEPISKREWARLSEMSPSDLRRLVSDYRQAKQRLVSSNMGLVHAVARDLKRRAKYRSVSLDEIVQEGSLGLIRAAELFDPERGLRFSTYATIWIKGQLSHTNFDRDAITIPQRENTMRNKIQAAWTEIQAERGDAASARVRNPSVDDASVLADRIGLEPAVVERHLRKMSCVHNVLSLDYKYESHSRSGESNGAKTWESLSGDDADAAEMAALRADVVSSLVQNLSEREANFMRYRYGLEDGNEHTLKECGERLGVHKETARLLQKSCLKKLREASNMESLQEYLLTVA